ncbi:glycosyltransferase family 4 protein [Candidatus Pacearchaeota archaeon]|nr:glycosyltransferase family 4 protein [Candidatus Pacearchaeota archaeon]
MKILSIAPTPFFSDRGCHVRILEETKALMELGHDVTICTYHLGRNLKNIDTKRIPNIPWYNKLEAGPSYHMLYLDALLLFRSLHITLKEKPDIIHAHLHEGALIGKLCSKLRNIPLVFDVQGSLSGEMAAHGFMKSESLLYKIIFKLETIINNMSNGIITSSTNMGEILKSRFEVDDDKIFIIPDGVDTNTFHPNYDAKNLRKQLDIDNDKKTVVFLGLLNEYQGVDLLIESIPHIIKEVDNAHFLIMGFPNVEKYKNMAEELGVLDNITFTGRIDYSEAPLYLNLGDIAVSPKITLSGEGNGKIYNYMACGLPTVVFDFPTNREILGDTGVYVQTVDSKSLAEEIIGLLLDEQKQDELGLKVCEKAVNEYSWIEIGRRITKLYNSAKNI